MNPLFQRAAFLTAAADLRGTPPDEGAEIAFAGRSNAGKSSAINALCHQTRLARTSKTPGRTQQLIFFQLDAEHRLVDLPGYGFARVSLAMKERWQAALARYLNERKSLAALVVVMDIRHPLTAYDRQLLAWAEPRGLPLLLLLTKADKLGRGAIEQARAEVRRAVAGRRTPVVVLPFSAVTRLGLPEAQAQLSDWLGLNPAGPAPGEPDAASSGPDGGGQPDGGPTLPRD